MVFHVGDKAFIVENGIKIREVRVIGTAAGFYTISYDLPGWRNQGGFRVKAHRLFSTQEEAEEQVPEQYRPKKAGYKSPYEYEMGLYDK